MQVQCPECGHRMIVEDFIVEDFIEQGKMSVCSECGASFDAEAHLQDDTYNIREQESYVVDWQIAE